MAIEGEVDVAPTRSAPAPPTPVPTEPDARVAPSSMSLSSLLAELRRRNVTKVALGYAIVAFVVGEAAGIFLPALNLPEWTITLVVALLVLGFPIALVLAWALELTPHGVVREGSREAPAGSSAGGGAAAIVGGGRRADDRRTGRAEPSSAATGTAPLVHARAAPERSIAVLPFTDMSAEHDQEYLGDGIAEEVIDALTRFDSLHVAARTSSFGFKQSSEDVPGIGRKLGVQTVLEGSVRKSGNRLRVRAQLISVADGYRLWSERYDRELEDVFEVQDDIARAVADALRVELLGDSGAILVSTSAGNAEAYDHYLKGRHAWHRRYQLGLEAALQHFERAIQLDPAFARSHAGVSDTCSAMGIYGFGEPAELRERATRAIGRALADGAQLPDIQFSAGMYELVFGWRLPRGLEHFREAMRLAAGRHPRSRAWLGLGLACQGRLAEARRESEAAVEQAPASTYLMSLHGLVCAAAGDFERARACFERVLVAEPGDLIARYGMGGIESWEGRHDEAIETLRYVYERGGHALPFGTFLAGALARAGRRREAEAVLDEIDRRVDGGIEQTTALPLFHAWAGEPDRALDALPAVVAARPAAMLTSLIWFWFTPLRSDPRWSVLKPFLEGDEAPSEAEGIPTT